MGKLSLFLAVFCVATIIDGCIGFGYYIQQPYYQPAQDLMIPQFGPAAALWQPNCDKKKESLEEGSSSESSSSESSSSESKESKESKGSGEEKEEGSSSKESKSSSEEEGSSSKEEKEEKKESEEGSGEKKEGKKKKSKESKSLFPPPSVYQFPSSQIMLNPTASYAAYMPYRTSYVVQQPISSYPVKTSYQYVMPTSTAILGGYSSPVVSRMITNPIAKFAYSAPAINYPTVSKTYVAAPSARLYSMPTYSYVKK